MSINTLQELADFARGLSNYNQNAYNNSLGMRLKKCGESEFDIVDKFSLTYREAICIFGYTYGVMRTIYPNATTTADGVAIRIESIIRLRLRYTPLLVTDPGCIKIGGVVDTAGKPTVDILDAGRSFI